MDLLSKIIALIMVGVLVFLLPLQYLYGHQLLLFDDYTEVEAIHLVDKMREKGFLDIDMYEGFLKKLNATGVPYDIDIEHAKPKTGSDLTKIEELPGSFVVSTDLERLPQISSFAAHTHTDACYIGHIHNTDTNSIDSCYVKLNRDITSLQTGHGYYENNSAQYTFRTFQGRYNYDVSCPTYGVEYVCPNCGYSLGNVYYTTSYGSPWFVDSFQKAVSVSNFYERYTYYEANFATKKNQLDLVYNSVSAGESNESITRKLRLYFGFVPNVLCQSCAQNKTSGTATWVNRYTGNVVLWCNKPETPVVYLCNQVVTSITPTNPTQTVNKGESIVTTATATYLDEHIGTVNCTSNFNPNLAGEQTVTLTYSGLVGNVKTTGTRTCTVNVTVKETNIPASLTVKASTYSVYNGTEPTYTVVVTYTNGSTKIITSGYTKSGWSSGYGIKTVTFGYTENDKNVTVSINITVKSNIASIEVIPSEQTVERYKEPSFTVKAWYEDGSYSYASGFTTSGFNKNNIGVQNVTIQYKENATIRNGYANVIVTPMKIICPICGKEYFLDKNDFDQGCSVCKATVTEIQVSPGYITVPRNEPLGISVTATFGDGHTEGVTGWTSNFDSSRSGSQLVMVTYAGKYAFVNVTVVDEKICSSCGFTYSLNEDGTDPGCPVCKELLISISASPENQTVEQGEDISLTVTGQYKDGHSAQVLGWSSSYDKNSAGEQEITIYYQNLTCTAHVKVLSEEDIQCSICGTFYNYRDYPWGCPICAGTVTGIEAKLLSGGTRTSYGVGLDLSVILSYRDGHREITYSGWQDNFDPFVLGEQTVTISYTDIFNNITSCTLIVNVLNVLTQIVCENGHVYYAEDGECPYCVANNGKVVSLYSDCHFTNEILNEIYENGIYYFSKGDYITIKVTIRKEGTIYSLGRFRKKESVTPITYGGEVA